MNRHRRQAPPDPTARAREEAELKAALTALAALLARIGNPRTATVAALCREFDQDPAAAWRALDSNAWWAGAGSLAAASMADNPGLDPHLWQAETRAFRDLLSQIAELLRRRGPTNPGLESWLLAFRNWQHSGI
ncbi:MAG: hypothetical protein EA400_14790 [Chromatiaceae bacterium]|nr:MAG: hypothetical protein EA400_14790 [Chromatiaceae bacterium]